MRLMLCSTLPSHVWCAVRRRITAIPHLRAIERLRLRISLSRHIHTSRSPTAPVTSHASPLPRLDESSGGLASEEDEFAEESAFDTSSPSPPRVLSGLGVARLDSSREWWEDNQIFGLPSPNNPQLLDRAGKHRLLLAIGQCQSLEQASRFIRRILWPATASLLTPHNYTFLLLTLHSHGRTVLQQAAYHSAPASQSAAPTASELSSLVCDVVEASFVHGWQLSTRSYACALHLLASLADPRCLQLLSSVEACQDVIVSDSCYGAVMAYLQRQRSYAAVCQLWRSMQLRYERDRRQWDVPLQLFLNSNLLDDEKQAEIATLAVGAACQQLWMYHTAITAALHTRQANTALSVVQQLHSWQQRYAALRALATGPTVSVSTLPSSCQPLFEHVNFRAAAVEPVWTALTYHSVLSVHAAAGEWWLLMLALRDMSAAGMLLPLHRSTVIRVAECAIQRRRWLDLRSLFSFLEQHDSQQLSLQLVGLLTKRLETAARTYSGEDARLAATESERLVRFCLACLEQQHIVRAYSTPASDCDTRDRASDALSFVVHVASAMPLSAIRRLVSVLLLACEQRRRAGLTATRLFFRCESEEVVQTITAQVRTQGGSTLTLRPDNPSPAGTTSSLLTDYDLSQQPSGDGHTSFSLSHSFVTGATPHVVLEVSAAASLQATLRDNSSAVSEPVTSVALHDSSCYAGRLLRVVVQLRNEANWPLVKRVLKRNKRRLASAGVEADVPLIEATIRCWAFRPTNHEEEERPTTIDRVLQSANGPPSVGSSSSLIASPAAVPSASFPLSEDVFLSDLAAAEQLCRDRRILHSLPASANQPAATLLSLHSRMSVLTVHCAVTLHLLQLRQHYQPLRRCGDTVTLPALFVQSLDERLLHIAAHFLHSVFRLSAHWLTLPPPADDTHSSAISLLSALRSTTSHPASAAPRILHIPRDTLCGWMIAGGQLDDEAWVERCLQTEEADDGDELLTGGTDEAEAQRTQQLPQQCETQ